MFKCLIKGHDIVRPNQDFKYAMCTRCGKVIGDKEIMKLYKKQLQKQNKKWLKGRCKRHFNVDCQDLFCEFKHNRYL